MQNMVRNYSLVNSNPDLNHKIDELQALWLMERLKKLDKILNKRRSIATYFSETFPEEVRIIGIEDLERTTFFEFFPL